MNKFLYIFGFQSPHEYSIKDGESSDSYFIVADSEEDALKWGETISEVYMKKLFQDENISWSDMNFARWIEKNPQFRFAGKYLEGIPIIKYGEFPNWGEKDE